jgi:hypothetical protein
MVEWAVSQMRRNMLKKFRRCTKWYTKLKKSLIADYVVLAVAMPRNWMMPEGVERGHNRNAFLGGTRLWQIDSHAPAKMADHLEKRGP